jgi:hypothetical protein
MLFYYDQFIGKKKKKNAGRLVYLGTTRQFFDTTHQKSPETALLQRTALKKKYY